jgi:HSP20 family protein
MINGRTIRAAESLLAVVPPIETWTDTEDKEFHISVPVPGMKAESLNVILHGKHLTLCGEQKEEEYSCNTLHRTMTLPDGVEGDKMTAELKDGILQITAPIAARAVPKKIEVKNATRTIGEKE